MTHSNQSHTAASDDYILTMVEGRVGRVIINRPKALNALSMQMCAEINAALLEW